jgi:hypothetical protein
MIGLSSPASVFGWAIGIADADRIGASASVQAANPINKKRFMKFCSLDRIIAVIDNASALGLFHGWNTQGKRPRRGLRAEAACVGTPGWVGAFGGLGPAEALALGYEVSRDLFWTATAAPARAAYCGQPLPASRAAQPWSSVVPACWMLANEP